VNEEIDTHQSLCSLLIIIISNITNNDNKLPAFVNQVVFARRRAVMYTYSVLRSRKRSVDERCDCGWESTDSCGGG
jgi:hypothetical protein